MLLLNRLRRRNSRVKTFELNQADYIPKKQIPTMLIWTHGGITVAVEGSWDNWKKK